MESSAMVLWSKLILGGRKRESQLHLLCYFLFLHTILCGGPWLVRVQPASTVMATFSQLPPNLTDMERKDKQISVDLKNLRKKAKYSNPGVQTRHYLLVMQSANLLGEHGVFLDYCN